VSLCRVAVLLTFLLTAACGTSEEAAPPEGEQNGPAVEETTSKVLPGDVVTLHVVDAPGIGSVVADREDFTLYRYEKDSVNPSKSSCTEPECTLVWVPLLAAKVEVSGVDSALVSLMERADGTKQVTLNGRPLYRYVDDEKVGDAIGNGVDGQWFAVAPNGEKARA
jgi:predicted lipoprotein with Yx(FWY)xxD motif